MVLDIKPSDALVVTVFVMGGITTVTNTITALLSRRAGIKAEEVKAQLAVTAAQVADTAANAATKAAEVKDALAKTDAVVATSLASIVETGNATHVLVNSQYGEALQTSAFALRALANLTKDASIEAAAVSAEEKLANHKAKQAELDKSKKQ